jgi:ABC-2 type transport system permease protein
VTRNSAAGVVSTLMVLIVLDLIGILPGLSSLSPYLLPDQFSAWMGFLREPIDWAPIIRSVWVCAAFAVPTVFAAYLVFLRRDVAGS